MTAGRDGVSEEKKSVASLKIFDVQAVIGKNRTRGGRTHLESVSKLFNEVPVLIVQFMVSKLHISVSSELVDSRTIVVRKDKHIVCGVPSG